MRVSNSNWLYFDIYLNPTLQSTNVIIVSQIKSYLLKDEIRDGHKRFSICIFQPNHFMSRIVQYFICNKIYVNWKCKPRKCFILKIPSFRVVHKRRHAIWMISYPLLEMSTVFRNRAYWPPPSVAVTSFMVKSLPNLSF